MKQNALTPEEERVIVGKGTERPFSGEYLQNKDSGTYVCKRSYRKVHFVSKGIQKFSQFLFY
jgi:peptide methionine sulfoxide reductase MsrB